jgi:hypothetical protein
MAKITVLKKVYWKAAGREMSGIVTQIMLDHAVVKSEGSEYIVRKAILSLKKKS